MWGGLTRIWLVVVVVVVVHELSIAMIVFPLSNTIDPSSHALEHLAVACSALACGHHESLDGI
jgi:hypothetical protein